MQKIMIFHLLFIFNLAIFGCQKEPIPEPEPPKPTTPKLDVLWQQPVSQDTLEHYINVHFAQGGQVLYCTNLSSPTATIQARNGENGSLKWIYNSFEFPVSSFNLFSELFVYDEKVIVEDDGDVYCIDYLSGQRLWYKKGFSSPLGSNKIDNELYTVQTTGSYPNTTSSSLVRCKIEGFFEGWDTVYTRLAVPDSFPIFNTPVCWVNPQGDSILVFEDFQGYNGSPSSAGRGKSYLTALNLRTRQVAWRYDGFKGSYIAPPWVDGDRLYVTGSSVYCIDLNTGSLLWQKPIEGGADGSLVTHNDILVVQGGQTGMWGLNKYTGDQIWYNKDTDGNVWELILFDGIVYCTSSGYGRIYAVNAETGATIWKEQSPNRKNPKTGNASFANAGVAIDPERRLLYTADKYYVMCIKLPEK